MAMADYIHCERCGGKAIYDGYWNIRDQEDKEFAALCSECSKDFRLVVLPKPKGETE